MWNITPSVFRTLGNMIPYKKGINVVGAQRRKIIIENRKCKSQNTAKKVENNSAPRKCVHFFTFYVTKQKKFPRTKNCFCYFVCFYYLRFGEAADVVVK